VKADTLTLSDAIAKVIGKALADSITLTDAAIKTMAMKIADAYGLTDLASIQTIAAHIHTLLLMGVG
jgi:hypothetical protein